MPLGWNVGHFNVVVHSLCEILDFRCQILTLGGLLEVFNGSLEVASLWVVESFLPCSGVSSVPVGVLKSFVLLSNIFELVFNSLQTIVIDFNMSFPIFGSVVS